MKKLAITIILIFHAISWANAQRFDLASALADGKLENAHQNQVTAATDKQKHGVVSSGIVWIKGVDFEEGRIEIELKGKNILQQSFLGIAFHGKDTAKYEVIYFRPFNFGNTDTLRQKHCVQYMKMPEYPWYKLRNESPFLFENAVQPVPNPEAWFYATIMISKGWITVYVDHNRIPSLKIKEFIGLGNRKIGLWSDGLQGEFANLLIKRTPNP